MERQLETRPRSLLRHWLGGWEEDPACALLPTTAVTRQGQRITLSPAASSKTLIQEACVPLHFSILKEVPQNVFSVL